MFSRLFHRGGQKGAKSAEKAAKGKKPDVQLNTSTVKGKSHPSYGSMTLLSPNPKSSPVVESLASSESSVLNGAKSGKKSTSSSRGALQYAVFFWVVVWQACYGGLMSSRVLYNRILPGSITKQVEHNLFLWPTFEADKLSYPWSGSEEGGNTEREVLQKGEVFLLGVQVGGLGKNFKRNLVEKWSQEREELTLGKKASSSENEKQASKAGDKISSPEINKFGKQSAVSLVEKEKTSRLMRRENKHSSNPLHSNGFIPAAFIQLHQTFHQLLQDETKLIPLEALKRDWSGFLRDTNEIRERCHLYYQLPKDEEDVTLGTFRVAPNNGCLSLGEDQGSLVQDLLQLTVRKEKVNKDGKDLKFAWVLRFDDEKIAMCENDSDYRSPADCWKEWTLIDEEKRTRRSKKFKESFIADSIKITSFKPNVTRLHFIGLMGIYLNGAAMVALFFHAFYYTLNQFWTCEWRETSRIFFSSSLSESNSLSPIHLKAVEVGLGLLCLSITPVFIQYAHLEDPEVSWFGFLFRLPYQILLLALGLSSGMRVLKAGSANNKKTANLHSEELGTSEEGELEGLGSSKNKGSVNDSYEDD